MSERYIEVSSCPVTRKLGFDSRAKARRWMRARQGRPGFDAKNVYLCPHCERWHLTSQDKRTTPSPAEQLTWARASGPAGWARTARPPSAAGTAGIPSATPPTTAPTRSRDERSAGSATHPPQPSS